MMMMMTRNWPPYITYMEDPLVWVLAVHGYGWQNGNHRYSQHVFHTYGCICRVMAAAGWDFLCFSQKKEGKECPMDGGPYESVEKKKNSKFKQRFKETFIPFGAPGGRSNAS
jgi:hypothetical protein